MLRLRMRTKFLLSMLLITAGLTCTSLLLVRHSVQTQARREIFADLQNSVSTFHNFQRERDLTLTRSAELVAYLPITRTLMTSSDPATIQDASSSLWKLAGSGLFVLANRTGRVVALHTATDGFTREMAQASLNSSFSEEGQWWSGAGHLYEVFLKPIYFGPAAENRLLGFLAVGYEIDDSVAAQVSRIAAGQVAFYYGSTIVGSTLTPAQQVELGRASGLSTSRPGSAPEQVELGGERFLATSLQLAPTAGPAARLTVLKSYDQATAFLESLNRLLLALGLTAVAVGSALVFLISHTFTRPLATLVDGVRALGKGDFAYPLDARGGDEVAEVTAAFDGMRTDLLKTHQELLDAERLATIGRMASSISHDLRHSLAAIVANAEFLCESQLSPEQREELYQEVRLAVNQMTDLIDSLLEFSRTREALRPVFGDVKDTVDRVVHGIRLHPEFHHVRISVERTGSSSGWFDGKKLERALYNLVLNACEVVPAEGGRVDIDIREIPGGVRLSVKDNGRGIPDPIRGKLFEPFISFGKENGTGLGLTVVQKIVQDHGGDVLVEKSSEEGTVFKVVLPLSAPAGSDPGTRSSTKSPLARTEQAKTE